MFSINNDDHNSPDGVGDDALFYGSLPGERADGVNTYCETVLSSDGLTLLVYDSVLRKINVVYLREDWNRGLSVPPLKD